MYFKQSIVRIFVANRVGRWWSHLQVLWREKERERELTHEMEAVEGGVHVQDRCCSVEIRTSRTKNERTNERASDLMKYWNWIDRSDRLHEEVVKSNLTAVKDRSFFQIEFGQHTQSGGNVKGVSRYIVRVNREWEEERGRRWIHPAQKIEK